MATPQPANPHRAEVVAQPPPVDAVRAPPTARSWWVVVSVLALALLVLAAFAGYRVGASGQAPADDSADAGFSRDMQTHHNQAVELSLIVRDRTADANIRSLAYDIATSQAQQSGQMYGWLASWGLAQTSSTPSMAWMQQTHHLASSDKGMGTGLGMGMANAAQVLALRHASGREAEREFLTLMIAHHRGGVTMAQAALELAGRPEVRLLAQAIHTSQQSEIRQLERLLAQRQ